MNNTISEIDRKEIVLEYKSGIKVENIYRKYNISKSRIYQILLEDNIEKRNPIIINSENIKNIINDYNNNIHLNKICSKYQIGYYKLIELLKNNNIFIKERIPKTNKNQYKLNTEYFDVLDKNEKYWILGWLFSDGYNCETHGSINLTVSTYDSELLETILKILDSDNVIQSYGTKKCSRFVLNSTKMSKRLSELGCIQRKSLKIEYPNYLDSFEKNCCFIRGFLEGDGSIVFSDNILQISIECWSPKFLERIQEVIKKYWNLDAAIYVIPGKSSSIRVNGGQLNKIKFLDDIYNLSFCPFYLKRKYEHFLMIKKIILEKENTKIDKVNSYIERMEKICKSKKSYHFYLKKENIIYSIIGYKRFTNINRVSNKDISKIMKGTKLIHKGWQLATQQEIDSAKDQNQLNTDFE